MCSEENQQTGFFPGIDAAFLEERELIPELKTLMASTSVANGPNGIKTFWVLVTPLLAVKLLARNIKNNRRYIPTLGKKYNADMREGNWIITHEGIAFDLDDFGVDGQHRLTEIADSGVSVWMLVTVGLSKRAIEVINRGKVRTLAHSLQVLGYQHADHRTVAIARATKHGVCRTAEDAATTDLQMRDFLDLHLEAIMFAAANCSKRMAPAPVAATIARAYYHVDTNQLVRFCEAIRDEVPVEDSRPEDKTARRFAAAMHAYKGGGGKYSLVVFRKCQNALRAWLDGKVLERIMESHENLFPLPEENTEQTGGHLAAANGNSGDGKAAG